MVVFETNRFEHFATLIPTHNIATATRLNPFSRRFSQGAEVLADAPRGPEQRADPGQTEAVPRRVQLRHRDGTGYNGRREHGELGVFRSAVPVPQHAEVVAEEHAGVGGLGGLLIAVAVVVVVSGSVIDRSAIRNSSDRRHGVSDVILS